MTELVVDHVNEHLRVIRDSGPFLDSVAGVASQIAEGLRSGATLFWCGNGGSAADCQHLAAELVGRFRSNRRSLRSLALTTDTSVITCVANDFSYDEIFSRQLEGLSKKGDILVAISTSGNSENVLRALSASKELGLKTIALLGKDGGQAKGLADFPLIVPSNSTARIQEVHILFGHILCSLIERELGLA